MIQYKLTSTQKELEEIIALQQKNLPNNISATEKTQQGFVTVQHSIQLLKNMHNAHPHVIAVHNKKVVGYALCMLPEFKNEIPVLVPMFDQIDKAISQLNKEINYMVMGQICIDINYRKQGIFRGLYNFMKENISDTFTAIITEVDVQNVRSSNAHKAIGFTELKKYMAKNQEWELILLPTK